MGIALAQHGLTVAQRVVKLNDTKFTGLPRFLGTETAVQALAEIEKPATALAMETKALAQPVSLDYLPMAGNIEDVATNAPAAVQRVRKQIDNTYVLLAIEAVQAAQAIDLRKRKTPGFTLSPSTQKLYDALRARVPFIDQDRALTGDFRAATEVLRQM
jgi:histidine ammonia-lyase